MARTDLLDRVALIPFDAIDVTDTICLQPHLLKLLILIDVCYETKKKERKKIMPIFYPIKLN